MPKHHRLDVVATGIVINKERTKTLLVLHKKYNTWMPPGGHVDENEAPHEAVVREIVEETGTRATLLELVHPIAQVIDDNVSHVPMPIYVLNEHLSEYKGLNYHIPQHIHNDFTYVLEASEKDAIVINKDESQEIKWFSKEESKAINTFDNVHQALEVLLQ